MKGLAESSTSSTETRQNDCTRGLQTFSAMATRVSGGVLVVAPTASGPWLQQHGGHAPVGVPPRHQEDHTHGEGGADEKHHDAQGRHAT